MKRFDAIPEQPGYYWLFGGSKVPVIVEMVKDSLWRWGHERELLEGECLVGPIQAPVPLVDFEVPVDLSGPVGAVSK